MNASRRNLQSALDRVLTEVLELTPERIAALRAVVRLGELG
jgi:hypothetical protein